MELSNERYLIYIHSLDNLGYPMGPLEPWIFRNPCAPSRQRGRKGLWKRGQLAMAERAAYSGG